MPASSDAATATSTTERSTAGRVGIAALLAVAVAGVIVVQLNTEDPNVHTERLRDMRGVLLYVEPDVETGRSRLWLWNLETGATREGPVIETPLEMVNASQAGPGWVGLISGDDGEMSASYLRGFSPSTQAIPLIDGPRVAWGPLGRHVAAVTQDEGACVVRTRAMAEGTEAVSEPFACDGIGVLVRSRDETFIGLTDPTGSSIASMSMYGDRLITEVTDAELAAVSYVGTILGVPTVCSGADQETGVCGGLSVFVEGNYTNERPPTPVRYGEDDASLEHESVVGWSRLGEVAFVVGSYRGVRGLYAVPVPPGGGRSPEPELVVPADTSDIHVTETATGELFVTSGETLVLVRSTGPLVYPEPPDGAPMPMGPILWLPAFVGGP